MRPVLDSNWKVSPEAAMRLQSELAARVVRGDDLAAVGTVAAVDVAYGDDSPRTFAAVMVFDAGTLSEVRRCTVETDVEFPYVPGLFSFREIPAIAEALKQLDTAPDLIVCDGHGIAHPRRCGLASHLGVLYDVPSIGCAKTHFHGTAEEPGPRRGSRAPVRDGGEVIGAVLRTQDNVKPLYVSTGHRIGLDTACDWILRLSPRFRLPEPIRAANSAVQSMKAARRG